MTNSSCFVPLTKVIKKKRSERRTRSNTTGSSMYVGLLTQNRPSDTMLNNPRNSVLLTEPTIARIVSLPSHLEIHYHLHNSHAQQPILSHLDLAYILTHRFIPSYNVGPRVTSGYFSYRNVYIAPRSTLQYSFCRPLSFKNLPTKAPSD